MPLPLHPHQTHHSHATQTDYSVRLLGSDPKPPRPKAFSCSRALTRACQNFARVLGGYVSQGSLLRARWMRRATSSSLKGFRSTTSSASSSPNARTSA